MTMFVFSAAESATVLTPGTGGQLPDIFTGCSGCTLLASENTGFVTGSFNGVVQTVDLVSAVYSDPSNTFGSGKLDFTYQVTNASSYGLITRPVAVGLGLLVIVPYAIWAYRDEKRRSNL